MSLRQFLNGAHAALVEEFQRPRMVNGITISGLGLEESLKLAEFWAEGYVMSEEDEESEEAAGAARTYQPDKRELTEEEVVAKNNAALAWLERRMSNVQGGGLRSLEVPSG